MLNLKDNIESVSEKPRRFLQTQQTDIASLEIAVANNASGISKMEAFMKTMIQWNSSLVSSIRANQGTIVEQMQSIGTNSEAISAIMQRIDTNSQAVETNTDHIDNIDQKSQH